MKNPVLVLGLGNTLFTDDAAGILAVRAAEARWQGGGVDFDEAMAGGLELLDRISGYQAVLVVDAAVTGERAPGEVYLIDLASLPAGLAGDAHGADLGTALVTGRRLSVPLPKRLELLAIEAGDINSLGETLTRPVAAAIPTAVDAILATTAALVREVGTDA
ncbi:MAG: hydrogenase maturation protease [Mycobacterium leprae]